MKMNLYQLLQILNLSVNEFVQKVDKKAYKLWNYFILESLELTPIETYVPLYNI